MTGKANSMTGRSRLQNRVELLGTCAMIAMTMAIANSSESFAQSALQGTPSIASGDATVVRLGPSGGAAAVDTITLNTQSAIINWNTFDQSSNTPINFLPQNTVARFQSSNQNFTVLNRVFAATPGQAISINGTVLAQNFSSQTDGNVWFYSPGGIIAGATSAFNVGSLVLTADDIDTTGGLFGFNNTIRFRGVAGSTSAVTILPGAQINLANAGSYLAIVAPQVTMGGTATINGSAAYIAAEQVDVRINGGAFDIAFITGSGVANALIHSGTTTGPALANGTIAMAAMPKNTAITMLVGGSVGYTPAATATVQNGTVVLSAGQDVVFGTIDTTPSATAANLTIGSGLFTTAVNAQATNIVASPNGGGPLSFTGNVFLSGSNGAELRADAAESISVGGDLTLIARSPGLGGTARLVADGSGSQVTVTGLTQVDASAFGTLAFSGSGGNAVGGTAEIIARLGNMFLGTTSVTANGTGGFGSVQSGDGTGGTARVRVEQTQNFGLQSGNMLVSAFGQGGQGGGQFPDSAIGGNATGGQASLIITNQGFASTGTLTLLADAIGGIGGEISGAGGSATAGTAQIDMGSGFANVGSTTISADEESGFAGAGGTTGSTAGTGVARVRTQSGNLRIGSLFMTADARASSIARTAANSPIVEGALRAGTAEIVADLGAISSDSGSFNLSASAFGIGPSFAMTAGAATGGTVNVSATNGSSISSLGLFLQTSAFGTAASSTPGNATAGTITLTNSGSGGFILDPNDDTHEINLQSIAVGASGSAPASATGGQISINFGQGNVQGISLISADSTGYAGASTTGGSGAPGQGGSVTLNLDFGADVRADSLSLIADGTSIAELEGQVGPGPGSAGIGGSITANLNGGTLNAIGLTLSASGRGAFAFANPGAPGGVAGPGTGGTATLIAEGASINVQSIEVRADGTGGRGGSGFRPTDVNSTAGGNGVGGIALFELRSGDLATGRIAVEASGTGGDGGAGDGKDAAPGGRGIGGTATFRSFADSFIATDRIDVAAAGTGGFGGDAINTTGPTLVSFSGGDGGSGVGGTALIDWQGERSAQSFTRPSLRTDAGGEGTDGGNGYDMAAAETGKFGGRGGDSSGGTSTILITGPSTEFISLFATASSEGGNSGTGNATRRGGDAVGGAAEIRVTEARLVADDIVISSSAFAGQSAEGRFGTGPRGGDATGGSSLLEFAGATSLFFAGEGGQPSVGVTPTLTLASDAQATHGQSGFDGSIGGAGGRGGNAIGGQVTVRAIDGRVNLQAPLIVDFFADAVGGNGGNGGNATTFQPTGGGVGGDAGTATGGTISLIAEGAELLIGDFTLFAGAQAGDVGFGGFDIGKPAVPGVPAMGGAPAIPGTPAIPPAYGGTGVYAYGNGGTINVEGRTGTSGENDARISGGNVTADVSATTGEFGDLGIPGSVNIRNYNTTGTPLQFGSLTVVTGPGDSGLIGGTTSLYADQSPITIARDLRVTGATSVDIQTNGAGSVTAGGDVVLDVDGFVSVFAFGSSAQPTLKGNSITLAGGFGIGTQNSLLFADTDLNLSSFFGTITTGALTAGRDISVATDFGNIQIDSLNAGRNALLRVSTSSSNILVDGTTTAGGYLEARGASLNFGNVTAGTDVILSSFNGGIIVGDVTGGDDVFLTVNGSAANPLIVSPDSQTGQGGTTANALIAGNIQSTGLGSDTAASGPATFTGAGPTGNVIRVRASGSVTTGDVSTRGRTVLIADQQTLTTGTVTATAGIAALARGAISLGDVTTRGLFLARDSSQYFALVPDYQPTSFLGFSPTANNGPVTLANVTAADSYVDSRGSVIFGRISTTGNSWIRTPSVLNTTIFGESVSAGGDVQLIATKDVSFTSVTAGGTALIVGTLGSASGTSVSANGYAEVSGATGVTLDSVISSNAEVRLSASNGAVEIFSRASAGTDLDAAGLSISIRSRTDFNARNLTATAGDIDISGSQNVSIANAQATGSISIDAEEATLARSSSTLDTTVNADDISITDRTTAGRAIRLDTLGTVSVTGEVIAPQIAVRSSDVVIDGQGSIGLVGSTELLSLTNFSNRKAFIGGASNTGGYSLSSTEMTRLAGNDVSIMVVPPSLNQASVGQSPLALTPNVAPDMTIDSFTFTGGQNLGPNGTLRIETPGKIRIVGQVALNGMTASNTLDLRAETAIEALPTGSVAIRGANGLTGTLAMQAEDIIASSAAALADVAAATNLTAASDRLGANNATPSDDGYFQAGGIVVNVAKGIYVQNSGISTTPGNTDFGARRGFTVGADGFTVVQATSSAVRVAINGRQVTSTTSGTPGSFVTGADLAPLIKFIPFGQQSGTPFTFPATGATAAQQQQAASLFDPLSTVNGCAIISSSSCGTPLVVNDPIRDIIAGDFGEAPVANLLPLTIVQLKEYASTGDEPLIDEPVTGAGNDDLWSVDDSSRCDPASESCK